MLSHDNISWTVYSAVVELKIEPNAEIVVSFLPLNHIAAQMIDIWMPMLSQVKKLKSHSALIMIYKKI